MRKNRPITALLALTATLGVATMVGTTLAAVPASAKKLPAYTSLGVEPGKRGGTLTMALGDSPQSFMYYGVIDGNQQRVNQQVFEGLVEYNLATGRLEGALAESWTVSPDGRVYTFKLRQGVKWHDGVEFTADDVIFTLDQIVTNPEARAGDVANFSADGKKYGFTKVDKYTVRITLPFSSGAFIQNMRTFIMPKHQLARFTPEGGAAPAAINTAWATNSDLTKIVGTGPFKYSSYTPGQKLTLVRNPDYWKVDSAGTQLPYVDRLDFLIIRGGTAQSAAFQAGTLDTLDISGSEFPDFKAREVRGENIQVVSQLKEAIFGSPQHIAFNFDAPDADLKRVFRDLRFRQAIQSATNRQRIIDTVWNGQAQLPGHGTAPASSFYADTRSYLGTFDLRAAAAKLDAMGLRDTDGDGTRNITADKELEFDLTYATDSTTWPAIATILQNDWKQIGVKANLKGVLSSALFGTALGGNYQAVLLALGDQTDPELRKPIWQPGGSLYYWHRSLQPAKAGDPVNMAGMFPWERRMYEIFERGTRTADQGIRKALYDEWQVIMAKNLPVIMILKPANITVVRKNLENFVYTLGVIPGYNPVPLYYFK